MITLPQFVRSMGTGAMKSLSCEVNESEDRLLSIADPKVTHWSSWKSSRRSICASPNVRRAREPEEMMPSDSAAGIAKVLLIVPVAHGPRSTPPTSFEGSPSGQSAEGWEMFWAGPQALPVHSRAVMVAREPPWSIEYSRSRSPAVRTTLGPTEQPVLDWLNSKSISVVPLGSVTRLQARLRKP